MDLRKFPKRLFTGSAVQAKEMYELPELLVNSVVPREDLEVETLKYAMACSSSVPPTLSRCRRRSGARYKQHKGEYFGNLFDWNGGGNAATDQNDKQNDVRPHLGTFEKGLNNVVKDNDMNFPPGAAAEGRSAAASLTTVSAFHGFCIVEIAEFLRWDGGKLLPTSAPTSSRSNARALQKARPDRGIL